MTSLTFDIYLRSTPERVWAVLTDPDKVPAGRFGMSSHTDWDARHQVPGQIAEDETDSDSAAGRRLTCEWLQTEHLTANGGHPSVVSFEFTAMGEVTRLSLVHSHLTPGGSYLKVVAPGWPIRATSRQSPRPAAITEGAEPSSTARSCASPRRSGNGRGARGLITHLQHRRLASGASAGREVKGDHACWS